MARCFSQALEWGAILGIGQLTLFQFIECGVLVEEALKSAGAKEVLEKGLVKSSEEAASRLRQRSWQDMLHS